MYIIEWTVSYRFFTKLNFFISCSRQGAADGVVPAEHNFTGRVGGELGNKETYLKGSTSIATKWTKKSLQKKNKQLVE